LKYNTLYYQNRKIYPCVTQYVDTVAIHKYSDYSQQSHNLRYTKRWLLLINTNKQAPNKVVPNWHNGRRLLSDPRPEGETSKIDLWSPRQRPTLCVSKHTNTVLIQALQQALTMSTACIQPARKIHNTSNRTKHQYQ